ncbi:MAG: hypothetical protein KAR38_01260, partial [Calditrichia bacterium]|nr:hypothetical protein [Calditrichia bacterium]
VLLKGKSNYLCLDRWQHVMLNPSVRLSEHEKMQAGSLIHWKNLTQTGDISTHNGFPLSKNMNLWMKFVAEDKYCPGKKCSFYNECYLMNVRNSARVADVVVVNHALLCSDIAAENSILGPYDFLIVDEAHNLEKTAIDYLGYEAVFWEIKNVLDNIYENNKNLGLLVQMENNLKFADKLDSGKKKALLSLITNMQSETPQILTEGRKFFTKFNNYVQNYYSSVANSENSDTNINKRIKFDDDIQNHLITLYEYFRNKLTGYAAKLYDLSESFRNLPDAQMPKRTQLLQDVLAKLNRLQAFIQSLDFISSVEHNDYVYWFESNSKYKEYDVRLFAVPLNIAKIMHDRLFTKLEASILTSATITVDNKFDYFYSKLGLNLLEEERKDALLLHSPFDYDKQALIAAPSHFPMPNTKEYIARIMEMAKNFIPTIGRGTLMLFTSYYMLKEVYYSAKQILSSMGILAMAQGIDGSRINIMRQFIEEH